MKTRLNTSVEREGCPGCGVSHSLAGGGPQVIREGFGGRPLRPLSFLAPQARHLWGAAEKKRDPKTGLDLAMLSPHDAGELQRAGRRWGRSESERTLRFEGSGPMGGGFCKVRFNCGQLDDFTSQEWAAFSMQRDRDMCGLWRRLSRSWLRGTPSPKAHQAERQVP